VRDPSGAHARRVFVDTSAYFAVANRRDATHEPASALMRQLVAERRRLFTTNFVLAELHALLLARLDRRVAARVLAEVDASELTTVVRVSARDERRAREIVFGYADKDFSLTDATCFAVMERLRIPQAFTLDQNFAQYGWTLIGPAARP
jgi:predicted nucleic acid-binding protein